MTNTRRSDRSKPTPAVQAKLERELSAAATDYRTIDAIRHRLRQAIQAAHKAGLRQVDILAATDSVWSREMVRQVCGADETTEGGKAS